MHILRNKAGGWKMYPPIFMWLTVLSVFFICTGFSLAEEQGGEDKVRFRWAFGAYVMTDDGSERKLEPITQDRALKSGDQFKMLVEPQTKCFVYLIHHNSQGEVKLLFPYTLQQFTNDYETARIYSIPQKEDTRFELDNCQGTETFYLLASAERLSGLESFLGQYESSQSDKKPEVAKHVLAEIHNVRKQHREMTTAAERPVRIGGTVRGLDKPKSGDISMYLDEISSTDFYARTFTIEHQ